jgi:circadian clock protein KaiC
MLGGEGFYRGTTILVSGTAGTGKTSLAATFADATCRRGERSIYFSFEESPGQLIRNLRSIGVDLEQWSKKNLLQFHSSRATFYGLEMHLAIIHKIVADFRPKVVILDPIGSLVQAGNSRDAHIMIIRLIDFLKQRGVTAFLTNLTSGGEALERTDIEISSIVDSWLFMRDIELNGERNRALYVLKSRGMAHSNQLREFLLTKRGIDLLDVYVGPEGVLTGSSRLSQEAREKATALARRQEAELRQRERARKREALEARIAAMRKEFETEDREAETSREQDVERESAVGRDREAMSRSRHGDILNDESVITGKLARITRKR